MTAVRKPINTTRVDVPVFWSFDAHLNRPAIHKIFYEFYLDCINSIDTAKVKIYEAHFDFHKGASFVFLDMPNFSTPSFIHNLFSEYSAFALQTAAKLGYFPSPLIELNLNNELRVFKENSEPSL